MLHYKRCPAITDTTYREWLACWPVESVKVKKITGKLANGGLENQ